MLHYLFKVWKISHKYLVEANTLAHYTEMGRFTYGAKIKKVNVP